MKPTPLITAGIDVGTGMIKMVLFGHDGDAVTWRARRLEKIRRRDPYRLTAEAYDEMLAQEGLGRDDIAYCATTGEGESIAFHTGHFYSMTTHARGALFLDSEARAALDIGALHGRAIRVDERGKVLDYKMTSQCASG